MDRELRVTGVTTHLCKVARRRARRVCRQTRRVRPGLKRTEAKTGLQNVRLSAIWNDRGTSCPVIAPKELFVGVVFGVERFG